MPDFVTAAAGGAIGALLTALFGHFRFVTELKWQRRLDGYTAILDAIHYLKKSIRLEIESINDENPNSDAAIAAWEKGRADLEKAADIGSFVITQRAEDLLKKLLAELDSSFARSVDEHGNFDLDGSISEQNSAIDRCLVGIKKEAQKHLNAGPFSLFDSES